MNILNIKETEEPINLDFTEITASKLMSEAPKGIVVTQNGNVISFTVDKNVANKPKLILDIDLSGNYKTIYFFRFDEVEIITKQNGCFHYFTSDCKVSNFIENVNTSELAKLDLKQTFDSFDDILEYNLPKVKTAIFYVKDLTAEKLIEFYKDKSRKNIFIFDENKENNLNNYVHSFVKMKNIDEFLEEITFGFLI